jgi:hypothetical protein
MSTRYTKKDAEKSAERLANTLGKKFGKCWTKKGNRNVAEIGCWTYDHNSVYGGGNINEIVNESGGVREPFGSRRLKPESFVNAVNMSIKSVEISRGVA